VRRNFNPRITPKQNKAKEFKGNGTRMTRMRLVYADKNQFVYLRRSASIRLFRVPFSFGFPFNPSQLM
jgi:hypothetical protein